MDFQLLQWSVLSILSRTRFEKFPTRFEYEMLEIFVSDAGNFEFFEKRTILELESRKWSRHVYFAISKIYTESEKRSVSLSQPKSRIHVKAINNPCSNKTIITASRGEAFAIYATPIEAHELDESTIRVLGETHTHAHVRNPTVTDETSIKQILVIRVSKEFRVRVAC